MGLVFYVAGRGLFVSKVLRYFIFARLKLWYNIISMKKESKMKNGMIGAIVGDIVGSRFEWHNRKTKRFTLLRAKGDSRHPRKG